MAPIIQTEDLTHVYSAGTPFERTAVEKIGFRAEKGELIGVIGHTGSGKSTFIQHLNGLLKPTAGRVLFNGQDIWQNKHTVREVRFHIGLVFQYPEYQLFEETVYKDIAFGPRNMKLSEEEIDERVREAAAFVGLDPALLEQSPVDLSGGQKRRVAIAGVIAMRPEVLILDEPTAGLDPAGSREILDNILAYHRSAGSTVILVSHSMEEIARTVQRLIVFAEGHVVMEGTPHDIFSRPEELTRIQLDVPEISKVVARLRALGLPLDPAIYTVEQARDALLRLSEGARHA
jgi:energy-coupling factor transport system ATP-binding protein